MPSVVWQSLSKQHRLARTGGEQLPLPHDLLAAHDGAAGPTHDIASVVGRPLAARGDPLIRDGLTPLEVDNREISIKADRHPTLAGNAKKPSRAGARHID